MACSTCQQIIENKIRLVSATGTVTCPVCKKQHEAKGKAKILDRPWQLTIQEDEIINEMFGGYLKGKKMYRG